MLYHHHFALLDEQIVFAPSCNGSLHIVVGILICFLCVQNIFYLNQKTLFLSISPLTIKNAFWG